MVATLAIAGTAAAQDFDTGLPAVEINEQAIFAAQPSAEPNAAVLRLPGYRDRLPVYDDSLGPPRSRLIELGVSESHLAQLGAEGTRRIVLRPPSARLSASPDGAEPASPSEPLPAVARAATRTTPSFREDSSIAAAPNAATREAVASPVLSSRTAEASAPQPTTTSEPMEATEANIDAGGDAGPAAQGASGVGELETSAAQLPASTSGAASVAPQIAATVAAAVPPPPEISPGPPRAADADALMVPFSAGHAELPNEVRPRLDAVIAALNAEPAMRLQLKAYADDRNDSASAARRLSLSRALAVRSYLIQGGVNSTRIDVRALGAKFESGPPDRVDVISVD